MTQNNTLICSVKIYHLPREGSENITAGGFDIFGATMPANMLKLI